MFLQATPPPDPLLTRVVENIAHYRSTLPSLTADESIESDLSQHGFYRARDRAEATMRVVADEKGVRRESRTFVTMNGKPVRPEKRVVLPFNLHGAFGELEARFFSPERLPCYSFTTLPARVADGSVQIVFSNLAAPPDTCPKLFPVSGLALIDPGSAQVRRLQSTTQQHTDDGKPVTMTITVDYSAVPVGAESFWLPTLLQADLDHGRGHFVARYSSYHRFTGTMRILPEAGDAASTATGPGR